MTYYKYLYAETVNIDNFGVSGSLIQGSGSYDYMYIGGSYRDKDTSLWDLAISRVDHGASSAPSTVSHTRLVYESK